MIPLALQKSNEYGIDELPPLLYYYYKITEQVEKPFLKIHTLWSRLAVHCGHLLFE